MICAILFYIWYRTSARKANVTMAEKPVYRRVYLGALMIAALATWFLAAGSIIGM